MKDFGTYVQMMATAIGNWFNWFMGDGDNLLYTLITLVLLEYLTSIMCAIKDRVLFKEVSFQNICGKVLLFVIVGVGHVLDSYVIGVSTALRTTAISFYIAVEGAALLKNAVCVGLPVPQPLNSVFEQFLNKTTDRKENADAATSEKEDNP